MEANTGATHPLHDRIGKCRPAKVLVVDDDPSFQQLMRVILADLEGHEVLGSLCGETAPALARQERPDLVILDLALPGICGEDVLARLRAQDETARTPVLILTAAVIELRSFLARAPSLADTQAMTKPFEVDALLQAVRELLDRPPLRAHLVTSSPLAPAREAVCAAYRQT